MAFFSILNQNNMLRQSLFVCGIFFVVFPTHKCFILLLKYLINVIIVITIIHSMTKQYLLKMKSRHTLTTSKTQHNMLLMKYSEFSTYYMVATFSKSKTQNAISLYSFAALLTTISLYY